MVWKRHPSLFTELKGRSERAPALAVINLEHRDQSKAEINVLVIIESGAPEAFLLENFSRCSSRDLYRAIESQFVAIFFNLSRARRWWDAACKEHLSCCYRIDFTVNHWEAPFSTLNWITYSCVSSLRLPRRVNDFLNWKSWRQNHSRNILITWYFAKVFEHEMNVEQ